MSQPIVKIDTITVTCPACWEENEFFDITTSDLDSMISQPCEGDCGKRIEICLSMEVHNTAPEGARTP